MEEKKEEQFITLDWDNEIDNDDPDTDFDVVIPDDYPNYNVTYPSRFDGELALSIHLDHVYENKS